MNFDDMDCSTSKPVEAFNCSSKNRGQRDLTLGALVFYYIDEHRDRMKEYFRYYDHQTLNDAIRIAALSLRPDGKRHAHQKEEPSLRLMNQRGDSLVFRIKSKCAKNFEDLRELVYSIIITVPDIGCLTIYDISLRIGAKLGLYPKVIYLHSGAKIGAKALGLNHRQKSLSIEDIPEPISSNLEPYEIEDFFCICEEELKDL